MNYSQFTLTAIQAALEAGGILQKGFETSFQIDRKEGAHNLVTEYDKLSEETIIKAIKQIFPSHQFLAEESGKGGKDSEVLWIIDPLDGTVNFAHNIPIFSVSIATMVKGEVVSGVVYHPMLQELFVAEKGRGAYRNGKRLTVAKESSIEKAILVTGFPYNIKENPENCIDHIAYFLSLGVPIRRLGSAALDLSYVAAGRFEGYFEASLQPWDVAAGQLIVEEAGGKVTDYKGNKRDVLDTKSMLASNGHLHSTLLHHLENYDYRWKQDCRKNS